MKKKMFIGILIIILIVLLIPKKTEYWDGGTIEYKAIIYKFTKYHTLDEQYEGGFHNGITIKLFGFTIYNNYKVEDLVDTPVDTTSEDFDFYIEKLKNYNDIRYNDYFTSGDRKIYLAGNIEEFYVIDGITMILKEYIPNVNRTMDSIIKSITDKLELEDILKDGGTEIYKSKNKDITMIVCNTIIGDKNILIGDYSIKYMEGDCKN